MNKTTATATTVAETKWDNARNAWQAADKARVEALVAYNAAYCTEDEALRFIENDLAAAETDSDVTKKAMMTAWKALIKLEDDERVAAFVAAEDRKLNWTI